MSDVEMTAPEPVAPDNTVQPADPKPNPAEKSSVLPEKTPEPKKDLDTIIKESSEKLKARDAEKEEGKKPEPKAEAKPEAKADAKAEPKETPEARAERERAPDGKFKAQENPPPEKDGAEGSGQEGEAKRPSEGRDVNQPPARFLPRAKEEWANVPESVRSEVHRTIQNMEKGMEEYKASHEAMKELRDFDAMAREYGTTIKAALENYTRIDGLLRSNPEEGMARVLATIGLTPEQYAQHVLGKAQASPEQRQQTQLNQTIQSLQQRLDAYEQRDREREQKEMEEAALREVETRFIAPFKATHERFDELEQDIVFFLNSGKVPFDMPQQQRLEAAYDMAERLNPAPGYTAKTAPITPAPATERLNPAGQKSVTGSPGAAPIPAAKKGGPVSIDEAIRRAKSRLAS